MTPAEMMIQGVMLCTFLAGATYFAVGVRAIVRELRERRVNRDRIRKGCTAAQWTPEAQPVARRDPRADYVSSQ